MQLSTEKLDIYCDIHPRSSSKIIKYTNKINNVTIMLGVPDDLELTDACYSFEGRFDI